MIWEDREEMALTASPRSGVVEAFQRRSTGVDGVAAREDVRPRFHSVVVDDITTSTASTAIRFVHC